MGHDKTSNRTKRNNPRLTEFNINFYYLFLKTGINSKHLDSVRPVHILIMSGMVAFVCFVRFFNVASFPP